MRLRVSSGVILFFSRNWRVFLELVVNSPRLRENHLPNMCGASRRSKRASNCYFLFSCCPISQVQAHFFSRRILFILWSTIYRLCFRQIISKTSKWLHFLEYRKAVCRKLPAPVSSCAPFCPHRLFYTTLRSHREHCMQYTDARQWCILHKSEKKKQGQHLRGIHIQSTPPLLSKGLVRCAVSQGQCSSGPPVYLHPAAVAVVVGPRPRSLLC